MDNVPTLKASRSRKNLSLPEAFSASFPLSGVLDNPNILTVDEFDMWAIRHHLFNGVNISDRDALNAARNTLRYSINNIALGDVWKMEGFEAFQIEVHEHGKSYRVVPAIVSFVDNGTQLPQKVRKLAKTRKEMLNRLRAATSFERLSLELQLEAKNQVRFITQWEKRAQVDLDQMEENFREFRADVFAATAHDTEIVPLLSNHNALDEDDDPNGVLS